MTLEDLEHLSLTEIIQVQNELSKVLKRRFGRDVALAFTDVVGSTAYFQRFGDEAGRRLLQRNHDLVRGVLPEAEGRVVDTAGDGVFTCYPTAAGAARALIRLQEAIARENLGYDRKHQLAIRAGLHFGPVLTDGQIVTGDAVNLSARVAGRAGPGEIRITRAVNDLLPGDLRVRSHFVCSVDLKGIEESVETFDLEWRDLRLFPRTVRIVETDEEIPLPDLDLIRFGRLREMEGQPANEVVLRLPEPHANRKISRWHFELRRLPSGYRLRQVSAQLTKVAGHIVPQGGEVPVGPGTVVELSGVATLVFGASTADVGADDLTVQSEDGTAG